MDIKRCYEILELEPTASVKDLKQAYKDIVNVWHPDRFSHSTRLKKKAEKNGHTSWHTWKCNFRGQFGQLAL